MLFEYGQYLRGCLILPLLFVLVTLCFLLGLLRKISEWIFHKKADRKEVASVVMALLVCGFFLSMNMGRIANGGIHLICERESDAVTIQGTILEIDDLGRFSFSELKTAYGYPALNGVRFSIDGTVCIAPTNGTLNVGDTVVVTYLPESGYVLEISSQ